MSRTIRRKNKTWSLRDYEWGFNQYGFMSRNHIDKQSFQYKKIKADYHRDSNCYKGVPHWYVRLYHEKKLRQEHKQIIHNWIKNPLPGGVILTPYIKNAGWYWW